MMLRGLYLPTVWVFLAWKDQPFYLDFNLIPNIFNNLALRGFHLKLVLCILPIQSLIVATHQNVLHFRLLQLKVTPLRVVITPLFSCFHC